MDRLIKARKNGKFQQIVAPGTMRFLDFATLQLEKGERHSLQTGDREYVLDIFSGLVTLTISTVGRSKEIYSKAGKREDVFSGAPVMSFIPPNSQLEIKADSAAALGIFSSPS
ncbi:MAG: 5-deoxy-glucuronate isomerase, partial [Acidobacteriota bacterium]|nr:5-deoxy-glucuronate isomerase [Acidobacteriota bacterium]